MGCCHSSNINHKIKVPERTTSPRVPIEREEIPEDEKEGEKSSVKYVQQDSIQMGVSIQNHQPVHDPKSPESSAKQKTLEGSPSQLHTHKTQPNIENPGPQSTRNDEPNDKITAEDIKAIENENIKEIGELEPGAIEEKERVDLKEKIEMKPLPTPRMESRNKLQSDESGYKITRNQHEEILKFVNEKKKALLGGMVALNQNLGKNIKEDEKLALIIEDIKNGNKDIENCLDDVMSYRFDNDKDYILALVDCSSIVKKILDDFRTYKRNLKTYNDFKNEMMALLHNYDPNNPDNRALYLSAYMSQYSVRGPREERVHSSIPFIPKEESMDMLESYNANMIEDQIDLRLELR